MSDDLHKRQPHDASKINLHEPWEVRYWTTKFSCTEAQLIAAVAAVGSGAQAVEKHLRGW